MVESHDSKITRKALRFSRKALKLRESTLVRKLDKDLLLRDKVSNIQEKIKTGEVTKKWKELFEMCYGQKYRVSNKERAAIKRLIDENLISEITAAMICLFLEYGSEEWYLEKSLVPSLTSFSQKFDRWKSKGYAIMKFLSISGDAWWVINKINGDLNSIPDLTGVLKLERDSKGRVLEFRMVDGKVLKKRIQI